MDYVRKTLAWLTEATTQTMHQFLVQTLHQCQSLAVMGVVRAHRMSIEMQIEYPQVSLDALQNLIREYDSINDVTLFNDLQRSIAVSQDDPGVGIRLAREVKECIQRIRHKDALGARIVALSHLMQIYHQDLQARHHSWSAAPLETETERVLRHAIKGLEGGDVDVFWAELSNADVAILATYLKVSPAQVPDALTAYLQAANDSLFVEP